MTNAARFIQVKPVERVQHFRFNLLEFYFFWKSERGKALPFGNNWILARLAIVPYILVAEVIFFRAKRYFAELGENVVGLVALREMPDCLFISSLGVGGEYRRFGIGTYLLTYGERVAVRLGKKWLELSVLKTNSPAQRLYAGFGFTMKTEKRWSFVLRKRVASF
jgi:ribosomal protein S18 acetylase RimI-like enzyme